MLDATVIYTYRNFCTHFLYNSYTRYINFVSCHPASLSNVIITYWVGLINICTISINFYAYSHKIICHLQRDIYQEGNAFRDEVVEYKQAILISTLDRFLPDAHLLKGVKEVRSSLNPEMGKATLYANY